MNPKINTSNTPLYDVNISANLSKHTDIWHKLLFVDYSSLNVSQISDICNECNSNGLFSGAIYCYRNLTNNKMYIGKTINPLDRHSTHISSSKDGSNRKDAKLPFHRAVNKYGIENFEYSILCLVINQSKKELNNVLNRKEKHYIKLYKTTDKNKGYNILEGGNSSPIKGVEIRQYSKFGQYIQTFDSIAEAKRQSGCLNIAQAIHKKTFYCNGYVFVPVGVDLPTKVFDRFKSFVIHQYTIEGEYIRTFETTKDAAEYVNGDQARISLCAKPPCSNIAYGFRWSRDKLPRLQSDVAKLPKYVCKYDIHGCFIDEYDNIVLAAKSIGCASGSHISLCLKDQWRKAGGYYWRTFKTDKIDIPNEQISKAS